MDARGAAEEFRGEKKVKILKFLLFVKRRSNMRPTAEPNVLTPDVEVLALIDSVDGLGPEVGARRAFVRIGAGQRRVPLKLRATYDSWISATVAARHGFVHDVHLGLHAHMHARSLGVPSMTTLNAFSALAKGAPDTIACLAEAGLLRVQGGLRCCGWSTTLCRWALVAWLEESLAGFDATVALCEAARRCDLPQLSRGLAKPGCDVDEQTPGWPPTGLTCLHAAARAGEPAAVALLLDSGANVNARSANGRTALHFASEMPLQHKSAATASLLLLRGADVRARDGRGRTALHAAALTGHAGVAALLVSRGAELHATDAGGGTALEGAYVTSRDECCQMEGAEWGGVVALLEALGKLGDAAEQVCDRAQRTWELLVAESLQAPAASGDVAALQKLLGCFAPSEVDARDWDGTTALHASAQAGHAEATLLLLERGADANVRNNYDDTPLHAAASEGRLATAELLVSRGADVHAVDKFGRTPRDHATKSQEGEWQAVVSFLDVPT